MNLTDEQRKLLVEALNVTASNENENGRYARDVMRNGAGSHFYAKATKARKLAALIEGAETVTLGPRITGSIVGEVNRLRDVLREAGLQCSVCAGMGCDACDGRGHS